MSSTTGVKPQPGGVHQCAAGQPATSAIGDRWSCPDCPAVFEWGVYGGILRWGFVFPRRQCSARKYR